MNVSLTPELEELINQKVRSGLYNSASEVIREGLRLLGASEAFPCFADRSNLLPTPCSSHAASECDTRSLI